jgi:YD repeat-containing protein
VAANESPLADAGLDQTVDRGATVLLDGTASRDPDGRITRYSWTVRDRATGATVTTVRGPRPSFVPSDVGKYAVELVVTDDDGATSSDTLYVTVEPGTGPSVTLDGPTEPRVGDDVSYRAAIEPGAADLVRAEWRVDGRVVANRSLTHREVDRLSRTFPNTDIRRLSVHIFDADGRTATATVEVRPRSGGGGGPDPPIAASKSPRVVGPRVVTGTRPLSADYSVAFDAPAEEVRDVRWHDASGVRTTGSTVTVDWRPGDHQFYAVVEYVDGSTSVATFGNGITDVVADPQPNVTLDSLSLRGEIGGTTDASDGYGNLAYLEVRVDGEVVDRWPTSRFVGRGDVYRRSLDFSASNLDWGREHQLAITAVDKRGQRTVLRRTVTPKGIPEVISSGFVNNPVDSYHPRIDASRYAGHHVIEVDLNGASPENVSWDVSAKNGTVTRLETESYSSMSEYKSDLDSLIIHSFWAGPRPGSYEVRSRVWAFNRIPVRSSVSDSQALRVTPSDPELRLNVTTDGTPHRKPVWGIVVDASSSFDPDGTDLNYTWKAGASPFGPENASANFSSSDRAAIIIEDDYGNRVSRSHSFHQYYAPPIQKINTSQFGLVRPNETLEIPIRTKVYSFTKNTYSIELEKGVRNVDAQIDYWFKSTDPYTGDVEVDRQWHGTLFIEASEFVDGNPQPIVVVRNAEKPTQAIQKRSVPAPTVVQNISGIRENISISSLRYQVLQPQMRTIEVQQDDRLEYFKSEGYTVTDVRTTGTEYSMQKYVQVREPKYEEREMAFGRSSNRRQFLRQSPAWSAAGTRTQTETVRRQRTEWRDKMAGRGHFTGITREVMTDPAEYRAERRYEYTTTEERTGTRTVERTKSITVDVEKTRTRTVCNRYFGCYEREVTYTVEEEKTITFERTVEYTYTVEETHHYWATNRYDWSHNPTGDTRRVKVEDAEYEVQFQFDYTEVDEVTTREYIAATVVQTQKAEYDWQHYLTTKDKNFAEKLSISGQYRIGSTSPTTEWELIKRVGEKKVITDSFDDESNVLETRATVEGDLHQRALNPRTGKIVNLNTTPFKLRYTSEVPEKKTEIIRNVTRGKSSGRCSGLARVQCEGVKP